MNRFATTGRWLGVAALMVALAVPALAQRNVTLRLNTATLPDTTLPSLFNSDASGAGIQLRGGLESGTTELPSGEMITWDSATEVQPMNVGGDYWEVNFQIPDDDRLNFKFYSQQAEDAGIGGWEDNNAEAGTNDFNIPAGTGDVALDLHYFNKAGEQLYDWRPFSADGDSIAVWFRVYMWTDDALGRGYDRNDDDLIVGARGNFGTLGAEDSDGPVNDWGVGEEDDQIAMLSRESSDEDLPGYDLFSGVVKYPASAAGMSANYKFYFKDSNTSGDSGYEGAPNREFTLPAAGQDTTLHWVYYGNSTPFDPGIVEVTSSVIFATDVAPLTSIGLFTADQDSVELRGDFNDWNCQLSETRDDCILFRDPGTTEYLISVPITDAPDSERQYKYYINFDEEYDIDIGWEEPLDYGGANRRFTFEGDPKGQQLDTEFFNSVRSGNVIPEGESVDVTFTVDMNPALGFEGEDAFDPSADSVSVVFEDNVWLLTQGYEPGDEDLITGSEFGEDAAIAGFKLTDPDEDGIYTGTLTVNGPSYNGIGYRYFYRGATRGTTLILEGVGGDQPGRRRYRYITDADADAFDFAQDTFKEPGVEATPWEINPTGPFTVDDFAFAIANGQADLPVANEEGPGRTERLALSAPRPNPTRARAEFDLTLESAMDVNVQVIDLMGRTVATLADGTLAAGQTTLGVDTSELASGVYVVRIQAGGEVATRRMTVIR